MRIPTFCLAFTGEHIRLCQKTLCPYTKKTPVHNFLCMAIFFLALAVLEIRFAFLARCGAEFCAFLWFCDCFYFALFLWLCLHHLGDFALRSDNGLLAPKLFRACRETIFPRQRLRPLDPLFLLLVCCFSLFWFYSFMIYITSTTSTLLSALLIWISENFSFNFVIRKSKNIFSV